jgi:hypothetical protein
MDDTNDKYTEIVCSIIDVFEDVLEKNNIIIPDKFRNGDDDESNIFGDTYWYINDKIIDILKKL